MFLTLEISIATIYTVKDTLNLALGDCNSGNKFVDPYLSYFQHVNNEMSRVVSIRVNVKKKTESGVNWYQFVESVVAHGKKC